MATKYAYVYDESNALAASDIRQAVENVGSIQRRFETDIPYGEWDSVIQEMWATRFYIDNPQLDRCAGTNDLTFKAQGRWRVSSIRKSSMDEKKQGIIEELRLGFLQPPGTTGDYPPSQGVSDWSGIDSQARIVQVREFDPANKALAGENRYYVLSIPGVATATVKEFCTALAARGTLSNPVFGLQTKVSGTWKVRGVRNEDQGDGSSVVMAALVDASGFTPGALTINDGWNQTVIHQFYKHLPDYPASPFPPVNVDAVDAIQLDTTGMTQQSPAIIYQIAGADFDQQGMWNITVIKRVAKPSMVEFGVSDRDGGYSIIQFFNQTLRWTTNTLLNLSTVSRNQVHPQRNEFNLYDGVIHQQGVNSTYEAYYNVPFDEYVDEFRWDHNGHYVQEEWRIQGFYVFNKGVQSGLTTFENTPPLMRWSYFHELGGDKYRYKLTTSAALKTKDRTSEYNISSKSAFIAISPI